MGLKIVVVGLGYVGLSNAVLLAQHNKVIGDLSEKRITQINRRERPLSIQSFPILCETSNSI